MNFAAAKAELHRQEIARLKDAIVPRLETLRAMTPPAFREMSPPPLLDAAIADRRNLIVRPTAPA